MRSSKQIGWSLALLGLAAVAAFTLRHAPAVAQNAPRQPAGRNGEPPADVQLRRYGTLLIRPVTVVGVVKDTGRDDFGLLVYYEAPRDEVHVAELHDAPAAKKLWADLAAAGGGLTPLGDLAIVRADHVIAAWSHGYPGVPNDVASVHMDVGAPEPFEIKADDQVYSRDQIRACWQALAALAPAASE